MNRFFASLLLALMLCSGTRAASPTPTPASAALPGEIWLNEFLPNPLGTDTGNEWIELLNRTDRELSVGGLSVARVSGTTLLTIPAGTVIQPEGYLHLMATGSIVNGGDTLLVKNGTSELDRVTYDGLGEEGESWVRLSDSVGAWTSLPTPGAANQLPVSEPIPDPVAGPAPASSAAVTSPKPAAAKKASTKQAVAKKLPAGGPEVAAYLLPMLLGAGYWYGRKWHHARNRR